MSRLVIQEKFPLTIIFHFYINCD
uniref:Uncharacterized protein n=1 Tax=Lepeophtheirus salmonis TaxID=72036 RepID=A0A0K2VEA1_LEPSM